MIYESGIYIVKKEDIKSFLKEVKSKYKNIEFFLPEEYIFRYFDKQNTHKIIFLGSGYNERNFNNHECIQVSWRNPKSYKEIKDESEKLVKNGCKFSNNICYVYQKAGQEEELYNLLLTSYDKNFAFDTLLEKYREMGVEVLSETTLKNNFLANEVFQKVKNYIKTKEQLKEK